MEGSGHTGTWHSAVRGDGAETLVLFREPMASAAFFVV